MKRVLATAACVLIAASPASAMTYFATLSGDNEVSPVASPASGSAVFTVSGTDLLVEFKFADLTSGLVAGHIHCCVGPDANAGVAIGFTNLPTGETTGSYAALYDLSLSSTFIGAFLAASGGTADLARARLLDAFDTSFAYINLHTSIFPGGEIRGQIASVPEPANWAMMVLGFGLVGGALRCRTGILRESNFRPSS